MGRLVSLNVLSPDLPKIQIASLISQSGREVHFKDDETTEVSCVHDSSAEPYQKKQHSSLIGEE